MLAVKLPLQPTTGNDRAHLKSNQSQLLLLGHTGKPQCWLQRLPFTAANNMSRVRALTSRCGWLLLLITQMLATSPDLLLRHQPVKLSAQLTSGAGGAGCRGLGGGLGGGW